MCLRVPEGSTWRLPSDQGGRHRKRVIKCTPIYGVCHALDKIRLYSPSAKKDEGRNSTLSEVICICTCSMSLLEHAMHLGPNFCPRLYTLPIYDFDLRATHARTLLPAALASVSFGFVLVRVRGEYALILYIKLKIDRGSWFVSSVNIWSNPYTWGEKNFFENTFLTNNCLLGFIVFFALFHLALFKI